MTTTPVWMKVMEVVIIVLFAIECASFHAHRFVNEAAAAVPSRLNSGVVCLQNPDEVGCRESGEHAPLFP